MERQKNLAEKKFRKMDSKNITKITITIISALISFLIITQVTCTQTECQSDCECLTRTEGAKYNYKFCNDETTQCTTTSGVPGYCYEKPEKLQECPKECECLTEAQAKEKFNGNYEKCSDIVCGYEYTQTAAARIKLPKYCFKAKTLVEKCPSECRCLIPEDAKKKEYRLCKNQQTLCGYNRYQKSMYCYEKPKPEDCDPKKMNLQQILQDNKKIKFMASTDCSNINKIELWVNGEKVNECTGMSCEYVGGPYKTPPTLAARVEDDSGNVFDASDIMVAGAVVGILDFIELCPQCPEFEALGSCVEQTCNGPSEPEHYVYDSLTIGCQYLYQGTTTPIIFVSAEGEEGVSGIYTDYCIEYQMVVPETETMVAPETENVVATLPKPNLQEFYCLYGHLRAQTFKCPYGCESGKCICTGADSDNGKNYNTKGTFGGFTDHCLNSKTLFEYYPQVENDECKIKSQTHTCSGKCENGECKTSICDDGVKGGTETGVDCGGSYCPPCSQCATGAKWAPHDTPCNHHWPTNEGPKIEGNTKSDSCELYELCHPDLDYIIEDAITCCEHADYAARFTGHREAGKEAACNYARTESGIDTTYNPTTFKKCLGFYGISTLGGAAVYMQGYFHGEWCCYDSDSICPGGCSHFKVRPKAWEMGTSASCAGSGGAQPDFQMGGHRCEYKKFLAWKWGKAGYWKSDTDYTKNSDSVVDVPAHASINRLSTGTCVDYSIALTTILRKVGYSKNQVHSVDGDGHWYNLVKFPGEIKWHYVDTVGNRGGEIFGGSYPSPDGAWYDYCRKLDDGCSNDYYSESRSNCPSNNNIYGCEGIPQ